MSQVFLIVKLAGLAEEARTIRRQEKKLKKWRRRVETRENASFTPEEIAAWEKSKWQVKIQTPPNKPLTATERKAHRANVWKERAKMRKLNPKPNPELAYKLWEHRTKKVRPESRAGYVALAYIKGVPYRVIEPGTTLQNRLDTARVWYHVTKFSAIEDTKAEKTKFDLWLKEPLPPVITALDLPSVDPVVTMDAT
jgi:hypothetical protein